MPGTVLASGVEVAPMALMNFTSETEPNQVWQGSPAQCVPGAEATSGRPGKRGVLFASAQALGLLVFASLALASIKLLGLLHGWLMSHLGRELGTFSVITMAHIPALAVFMITAHVHIWYNCLITSILLPA